MVWVVLMGAGLWLIGRQVGAPVAARWLMIGLLYVAVLAALVVLPSGHALSEALGGSAGEWLAVGGIAGLVAGYRSWLGGVRARVRARDAAAAPPSAGDAGGLGPVELERYARHIVLREIGGVGQRKLKSARVLVIGAGGLGSPALLYLAAAGVGTLGVIDDDAVENANLQRQVIHSDARIGMPKVFSAEKAIAELNPWTTVRAYHRRFEPAIAEGLFADYDLVLDGTDNFDTRYAANRAAVATRRPLVAGALSQWEGQLAVFDPASGGPCYRCIFPEPPAPGLAPSCAEAGVLGPLPGVLGAMMAAEAVKLIAGAGQPLVGRMLIYDALWGESRLIRVAPRADCPDCGGAGLAAGAAEA